MPQLWKSAKDADSHSCLENSPQKTLRVSHIPTAPAASNSQLSATLSGSEEMVLSEPVALPPAIELVPFGDEIECIVVRTSLNPSVTQHSAPAPSTQTQHFPQGILLKASRMCYFKFDTQCCVIVAPYLSCDRHDLVVAALVAEVWMPLDEKVSRRCVCLLFDPFPGH